MVDNYAISLAILGGGMALFGFIMLKVITHKKHKTRYAKK